MSNDIAISIENLGKRYRYGGAATLSSNLRADITDWIKGAMCRRPDSQLPISLSPSRHETLSEVHERHIAESPDYFWALKNINLEIKRGEVVGIIGRNGAGKSTLLKILSRITSPTVGKVTYYGRIASLLEVGTGFHRELTGRENIYLNGSILGMKRVEIAKNFDEIVDFSGVEKFIDTPVKFYSSGMYVRLAFAIAAQLEPDILIVDEVLAVGDATFQKKCLNKMDEVSRAGRAVMFVSHNMSAVKTLCPRVVLVQDGIVQLDGDADKVVSCYLSEEASSVYLNKGPKSDGPYVERIAFSDVDGVEKEYFCNGETLVVKTEINNPNRNQLEVEFAFFDNAGCKLWNFTHSMHNLPPITGCPKARVDVVFFVPKINAREIFVHVGLHIVGYHVTHYVDHITSGLRYFIKDSACSAFQHNDAIMPCPVELRVCFVNS